MELPIGIDIFINILSFSAFLLKMEKVVKIKLESCGNLLSWRGKSDRDLVLKDKIFKKVSGKW